MTCARCWRCVKAQRCHVGSWARRPYLAKGAAVINVAPSATVYFGRTVTARVGMCTGVSACFCSRWDIKGSNTPEIHCIFKMRGFEELLSESRLLITKTRKKNFQVQLLNRRECNIQHTLSICVNFIKKALLKGHISLFKEEDFFLLRLLCKRL